MPNRGGPEIPREGGGGAGRPPVPPPVHTRIGPEDPGDPIGHSFPLGRSLQEKIIQETLEHGTQSLFKRSASGETVLTDSGKHHVLSEFLSHTDEEKVWAVRHPRSGAPNSQHLKNINEVLSTREGRAALMNFITKSFAEIWPDAEIIAERVITDRQFADILAAENLIEKKEGEEKADFSPARAYKDEMEKWEDTFGREPGKYQERVIVALNVINEDTHHRVEKAQEQLPWTRPGVLAAEARGAVIQYCEDNFGADWTYVDPNVDSRYRVLTEDARRVVKEITSQTVGAKDILSYGANPETQNKASLGASFLAGTATILGVAGAWERLMYHAGVSVQPDLAGHMVRIFSPFYGTATWFGAGLGLTIGIAVYHLVLARFQQSTFGSINRLLVEPIQAANAGTSLPENILEQVDKTYKRSLYLVEQALGRNYVCKVVAKLYRIETRDIPKNVSALEWTVEAVFRKLDVYKVEVRPDETFNTMARKAAVDAELVKILMALDHPGPAFFGTLELPTDGKFKTVQRASIFLNKLFKNNFLGFLGKLPEEGRIWLVSPLIARFGHELNPKLKNSVPLLGIFQNNRLHIKRVQFWNRAGEIPNVRIQLLALFRVRAEMIRKRHLFTAIASETDQAQQRLTMLQEMSQIPIQPSKEMPITLQQAIYARRFPAQVLLKDWTGWSWSLSSLEELSKSSKSALAQIPISLGVTAAVGWGANMAWMRLAGQQWVWETSKFVAANYWPHALAIATLPFYGPPLINGCKKVVGAFTNVINDWVDKRGREAAEAE